MGVSFLNLSSTIGRLRVMICDGIDRENNTTIIVPDSIVPLHIVASICGNYPDTNAGISQAICNSFKLIGKSGTQYDVILNNNILSLYSPGANTPIGIIGSTSRNHIAVPRIYITGDGWYGLANKNYYSGVAQYTVTQTQVTATSPGIILIDYADTPTGSTTVPLYNSADNANGATLKDIIEGGVLDETDPYADIDGEGAIGGGGSVGVPGFPGLTATDAGVIGLFAPSASQMRQLADYMWTDFGGTATDVFEVLQEILEAFKRSISNPLDYVVGLNIIPSQGLSVGSSHTIRFGFTSSGVSMPRLSNQYFEVDCGSISFPTLCGDTFLDYAPYSKFSIYLPYIGVKDVDANDFVGHTIGVKYHGDVVTGGVTAYVTKDGSVMYQYSGCCALNVPLSADSWGETISGAVQIATSLVAGAAGGGAAGVSSAAANGAANVAANPSMLSPQVSHSGAVSGGAGCMGVQYPFVIREAVRFHSTAGFNKYAGYPSYYNKSLGDVSGFTTVVAVHLENIPATNVEIEEIETLLKNGVIL